MDREAAVDRVVEIVETVESDPMPVPIREIWVYGDVAIGLDPIDRLDVYLTKDLLFGNDAEGEAEYAETYGIRGVGKTVSAEWAERYPQRLRANDHGHAAPERCLAAHLLGSDEPIHLEVCNAGFEHNVTQRLEGAVATGNYDHVLDPRGVCLWIDGTRSDTAVEKLRESRFAFPTLPAALQMLGADAETARIAAEVLERSRREGDGPSVRSDVV